LNYLRRVEVELRMAMLLTGARNVKALRGVERKILAPLREWIS